MTLFNSLRAHKRSQGWHDAHRAIDLATPIGAVWRAPEAGVYRRLPDEMSRTIPTHAGRHGVIVLDNGDEIRGCHLQKHLAADGAQVVKGEALARTGNTGYVRPRPTLLRPHAGAHFHTYGIRKRTGARFDWTAGAEGAATGVVDTPGGTLRMRKSPRRSARVVDELPDGTRVQAVRFAGKWWKIRHRGRVGWIHAGYLR